jgi:hypothetical protein
VTIDRPGHARDDTARAHRWRRAETALLFLAAVALVVGVATRQADPSEGFSAGGALAGLASQLPTTLPAAILVAIAMLLDLTAGAVLLRLVRQAPFVTWSDLLLGGFAGAVLLDALLLFTLGGAGLFRQQTLAIVLAALVVAGLGVRPLVAQPFRLGRVRPARWLLIGLVWSAPLLLSLASPVVPYVDELPNHVAPAEHLRVFGQIASLATYPSPLYGPSRLFLGYTALMGTLSTLTGLPAALAMSASVGSLAIVSAVAARRLASALFGREAGFWALLAFCLSFSFVRLPDARDSVVALPLAALAFALLAASGRPGNRVRPAHAGPDWLLAAALTAATLVHPLVGALTAGSVVLLVAADPARHARRAIPALAATAIAVLPQAAVMLGLAPAPAWGIVAFAAGAVLALGTARVIERGNWSRISPRVATAGLVLAGALAVLVIAVVVPGAPAQAGRWLNPAFPFLFAAAGAGTIVLVPAGRAGRRLLLAPLAIGGAALLAVAVIPGSSLLGDALRYEVPKAVGYWLPWACVPATAGLVAAVVRWRGPVIARFAIVGGFLAFVLLPAGPPAPDSVQASHAVVDDLAFDLRTAEFGGWQGYPDSRLVVDAAGRDLLGFLREEVSSGQLGAEARVLHVARSYEPWASVPIAVFTGLEESVVCEDATLSIFTAGGRIYPLASLATELRDGYSAVVLEPAGLPAAVRSSVIAAGYRSVFTSSSGEVFMAPAPAAAPG